MLCIFYLDAIDVIYVYISLFSLLVAGSTQLLVQIFLFHIAKGEQLLLSTYNMCLPDDTQNKTTMPGLRSTAVTGIFQMMHP